MDYGEQRNSLKSYIFIRLFLSLRVLGRLVAAPAIRYVCGDTHLRRYYLFSVVRERILQFLPYTVIRSPSHTSVLFLSITTELSGNIGTPSL